MAAKEGWHFPPGLSPGYWMEFLFVWRFYERPTLRQCLRVLRAGDVAVDVGAHMGYFTRHFAQAVGSTGKVIAIEPNPSNAKLLRANTARFPQVEVIEAAATDRTGDAVLWETWASGQHTLTPFDRPDSGGIRIGKFHVSSVRLDDILKDTTPRLIKMDVEGSEPAALRGMRETLARANDMYLVVEFAPRTLFAAGEDPADFLRSLQSQGFVVHPLDVPASNLQHIPREARWTVNLWCTKKET